VKRKQRKQRKLKLNEILKGVEKRFAENKCRQKVVAKRAYE
jgi:hypothetical protein